MGTGRWSSSDWDRYSKARISTAKTVDDIFDSNSLDKDLNPYGVKFRESCDSTDNPNSTPIIIALDVTGSMGFILDQVAREGLKKLATEVYARKPVSDPHIMFMGVGDANYDSAPLQVTQFEADIRIVEQLTKIYLERGGGGNNSESYTFPWYFAAMHTKTDALSKRGKKGYIFTIGDEMPNPGILGVQIERFLGYKPQFDKISSVELLDMVSKQYEVYHIIAEEGSYCRGRKKEVHKAWTDLIGQRAILLPDHEKIAEVIVSILQVANGESKENVVNSWDGSTSCIISDAITSLTIDKNEESNGVIKF